MVLFQRFWRWLTAISRAEWLMTDEPSSLGEVEMCGAVSIERRELIYCYIRKSTTFDPPPRGPTPVGGARRVCRVAASTTRLAGSEDRAGADKEWGFLMMCHF